MSILEGPFREWNHSKIMRLTDAGCSDETIASAINDEMRAKANAPGTAITGEQITSYKEIAELAGRYSLVSEKKVKALSGEPEPTSNQLAFQ
ncbi:hypothetical protein [Photobacterium sp. OFAV2-7]|uniref:hypothetical protein n=1 Tax=Photobacterium sp. OFAV2-7 TaxID=2917748 RepID=UPI001EF712CC|nr:hypothetical protein [Photobacterium sp. OFAV2-7]MCG7584330.1 hypothetical protein [Photobacterium sp. OFAV2-7]